MSAVTLRRGIAYLHAILRGMRIGFPAWVLCRIISANLVLTNTDRWMCGECGECSNPFYLFPSSLQFLLSNMQKGGISSRWVGRFPAFPACLFHYAHKYASVLLNWECGARGESNSHSPPAAPLARAVLDDAALARHAHLVRLDQFPRDAGGRGRALRIRRARPARPPCTLIARSHVTHHAKGEPMLTHVCKTCHRSYDPEEFPASRYQEPPYDYARGGQDHCLACWLCVGPLDEVDGSDTNRGH